jgi:hypothetical protein
MVNQKSNTPFAQRNFLNTIRAMFKWAMSEERVPDDPSLGVTRQKIESTGYRCWEDRDIAQYKQKHALGTMERLAIELLLTTSCRSGDVVKLGPQHIHEGLINFEQSKTKGSEKATVAVPICLRPSGLRRRRRPPARTPKGWRAVAPQGRVGPGCMPLAWVTPSLMPVAAALSGVRKNPS